MVARFVVRVGRRWRELDLVSGRVSGLGDVSLVRVRRGRLEVVPRAPALRALRTLLTAGSKRSAAKDGPRLSQIRYPVNPRRSKGRQERQTGGHRKTPPVHTCCQQHHYQCNTDANFNSILRPLTTTVGVQCSGQAPAATTLNTQTDRVTDQTEETLTISLSQRDKDHGSEKLRNKNHDSEEPRTKDHGGERIKRRTLLGRKRQTQESVSSINAVAALSETLKTENSRREPVQAKLLNNLSQESVSSDSEFESEIGKNKFKRNKGPGRRGGKRRDHGSKGRKAKKNEQTHEGACKELVISEETVLLLRGFIERDQRNVFGVDLELYDTDDAYKAQFFYRLNPLVDLERCPQISRMLRERASQADTVSLKAHFITKLGLRSVAESSGGQSRYRMRRRGDVTRASSEPGKENPQRDRGLEERERSRKDNKLTTNRQTKPAPSQTKPKTRDSSRKELKEVVEVSSNGGETGKRSPSKPATGKLAAKRVYSHSEDAFIVRWVCGEGRAKLVNGNRLWGQLQPQHQASTGCFRSWHSLRNRYLRYLLPTLDSLQLPPTEAARLRAAAATGSLKARKQPPRRNSAFQQPPVRSAWARRPRPPPPAPAAPRGTIPVSDTEETQKHTLRSTSTHTHTVERTPTHAHAFTHTPTYSQLTERFARRHRSTPDTVAPTRSDTDTVAPTRSDTDTVAPTRSDTDTVAPTRSDTDTVAPTRSDTDTVAPTRSDTDSDSDTTSLTTDTDTRIRHSSESDSRHTPQRRATRQSIQNGRHSDKTGRNDRTNRRSKSLDSDTDSLSNRRRSARHDKSGRLVNNSGHVADIRGSNKRKRNASQDSDTDSQSNKRRKSRRLDTDGGRQNRRTNDKMADKRRSQSLDSDFEAPLYSRSNSKKSVDKSGRQRAEDTKRNESGQRVNKSDPRRDKSGRFRHTTDRQNGSVRGGDKNDSTHTIRQRLNADQVMSKNYQNSAKSDRNDRQQRSGRHKDGHSEDGRHKDGHGEDGRHKPRTRRLYNPNAI